MDTSSVAEFVHLRSMLMEENDGSKEIQCIYSSRYNEFFSNWRPMEFLTFCDTMCYL